MMLVGWGFYMQFFRSDVSADESVTE